MSFLSGACGVSRWDGLNNESVYERWQREVGTNGGNVEGR